MSQVLKGGVQNVGNLPPKAAGIGKQGVAPVPLTKAGSPGSMSAPPGQPPAPGALPMMTPGMPGILPGSVLAGHMHKMGGLAAPGMGQGSPTSPPGPTPIVGAGASLNGSRALQQTNAPSAGGQQNQGLGEEDSEQNLANTKEKTPMCLINELARYNKIQHQYTLTDEQGPAHKKVFYVKLKLGEEEYSADGPSIKKAQHSAASTSLENTQYKQPPPKPPRNPSIASFLPEALSANPSITPTVELNALAMQLGEPAIYRPLEPARNPYNYPANLNFRGAYNQRYHPPRYPRVFYVSLKVGQREFIGEGATRQVARHNAAGKALKVLSALPITRDEKTSGSNSDDGADENDSENDPLKSEISLVHEIALKRNMQINFEVIKESGPPHMKTFVTRCTCGDRTTDGEGNSKKLSKKRAAEQMMEELQGLPPLGQTVTKPKKNPVKKKNSRILIKKADADYGVGINPISRLIQIQQAKKEKEPVYSLMAEKGMPRRKEFVMQVTVGEQTCTGVGPNKKLAKRSAAEAMLQLLGYSRPSPQPSKPTIKPEGGSGAAGDKKVTFLEQEPSASRQLVPGLLLMPDGGRHGLHQGPVYLQGRPQAPYNPAMGNVGIKYSPQTTAAIAKELLDTGSSPTAQAIAKYGGGGAPSSGAVSSKARLLYLAEVLNFQVDFTDFPKGGSKSEYLSLVSLSTNPPQVSHGAGPTIEDSHEMAAVTALRALVDTGLDSVTLGDKMAGGDGPQIKNDKQDGMKDMKQEAM